MPSRRSRTWSPSSRRLESFEHGARRRARRGQCRPRWKRKRRQRNRRRGGRRPCRSRRISRSTETAMEATPLDTALHCFVAVARHHGLDLSVDRIMHAYALTPSDQKASLLPKIARRHGFRAKVLKLKWAELQRLGEAFPAIARLKNGNSVIVLGFRDDRVCVLD